MVVHVYPCNCPSASSQLGMLATLSFSAPHFPSNSNSSFSSLTPLHSTSLPSTSNGHSSFLQIPSLKLTPTSHNSNNDSEEPKIKMPTAPWMTGPLLLPQGEVLDLSKPTTNLKKKNNRSSRDRDRFLTEKVPGRMGKKAAKEIAHTIEKLKKVSDSDEDETNSGKIGTGLFAEQLVGNGNFSLERTRRRLPWVSEDREMVFHRPKREKVPIAAELSLDKELLWRLRGEAMRIRKWVKVKKAGVTDDVVNEVHSVWVNNELALLRFDLPLCRNMDRAKEIVELKTGGLVVWSKKDMLAAYRGVDYESRRIRNNADQHKSSKLAINHQKLEQEMGGEEDCRMMSYGMFVGSEASQVPIHGSLYEREGDRLLEGLGPRFVDWWYPKPLPVDADLLPEIVPGFKTPFRLPPPKVRPKLMDDELTYLRKFALYLPTHFVLGRNSGLQGLAAAILKLWERCIIAKLAIKWGVQNTSNELMASELKRLTGGTILLRNKYFIILYRGKDFLPGDVASLVVERELELRQCQLFEEDMRRKATRVLTMSQETPVSTSATGTLSEFHGIQEICRQPEVGDSEVDVQFLAEKDRLEKMLRRKKFKLALLRKKIRRTAKELSKLNSKWTPSEEELDQELLTDEERECLKKIGLKMDSVLVLGRRGVFDGVVEGINQHWKHREVVKVISKQRNYSQVIITAMMLERESGGTLISVDKQKEVYSIIIYRGKNYMRPLKLGNNLLDKKKALQRSLEMQRLGSLKFFAYQREKEISDLKLRLDDLERKQGL